MLILLLWLCLCLLWLWLLWLLWLLLLLLLLLLLPLPHGLHHRNVAFQGPGKPVVLTGLRGDVSVGRAVSWGIKKGRISPRKINMEPENHPKITHLERNIIFHTIVFRFHVNLPGCRLDMWFHWGKLLNVEMYCSLEFCRKRCLNDSYYAQFLEICEPQMDLYMTIIYPHTHTHIYIYINIFIYIYIHMHTLSTYTCPLYMHDEKAPPGSLIGS